MARQPLLTASSHALDKALRHIFGKERTVEHLNHSRRLLEIAIQDLGLNRW